MKQKREAVISEQFVKFLQCFNHWIKERYLNEFNINGKGNQPLTNQQFCILKAVEDITDCTISKLENEMHVSRSSLSIGVSKLVKEGYIRRQYPNEEDDRRKMYL
jgi:DNA-binding MarR family transcriptional regulator